MLPIDRILVKAALGLLLGLLVATAISGCNEGGSGGSASGSSGGGGFSRDRGSSSYIPFGLDFSPYIQGQDPNLGATVNEQQVRARLGLLVDSGQRDSLWIRTYGVSGGLELIPQVARQLGFETAIGAWLDADLPSNELEIVKLIELTNAGLVDLAIVGSETLEREELIPSQLIDYIERVRQETLATDVPITTADNYTQLLAHPGLMDASDLVMPNYYPYWEGVAIDDAIPFLYSWHLSLVAAAGDKPIIISEVGWPSDGETLGEAVPSPENAARFFLDFVSWARAEQVDYFYFEALDEPWKAAYEGEVGAHCRTPDIPPSTV